MTELTPQSFMERFDKLVSRHDMEKLAPSELLYQMDLSIFGMIISLVTNRDVLTRKEWDDTARMMLEKINDAVSVHEWRKSCPEVFQRMGREYTVADFLPGQKVTYVPYHAKGDRTHADCEEGVVTSTNDTYVFVRFKGEQSQACKPDQLSKRS